MNSLTSVLLRIVCALMIYLPIGCSVSKTSYAVPPKSDPESLKEDLTILKHGLEKFHPSLYSYCTKNTLDQAFKRGIDSITDSLSDADFAYRVVGPILSHIRCGHTSVSISERYKKYQQSNPPAGFPLFLKFFGDTMMVSRNLNRTDSMLKKGTILLNINGMDSRSLKERLFASFPMDGYSESVNLARLNNNFPFYHRVVMGIDTLYSIQYLDDQHTVKSTSIPAYKATPRKNITHPTPSNKRSEKPAFLHDRELSIDSGSKVASMYLANFEQPVRSHRFIRKSFIALKRSGIEHLIIDLRSNGGGVIDNEVFLARHLRNTKFRVADSAMAVQRGFLGYGKFFRNEWLNGLIMMLFTKKDENGYYHMTNYWEKRQFKPVKRRFFQGQVYILTGGMTFSAASLFCITLKGQENVTLIGEETGGSGYANNGLLIPDFVLPNSRVKVRMPLFRLVPNGSAPNNGRGVIPDILVSPNATSLMQGYDPVMRTTLSLIRQFERKRTPSSQFK